MQQTSAQFVNSLIKAGADVNAKTGLPKFYTALMFAAENGHIEVVNALVKAGANVNAKAWNKEIYKGYRVLMFAAENGHIEVVNALIKAGANVNAKTEINFDFYGSGGHSVLMFAAENGHTEVVNALIKAGADVNAKDLHGVTALMLAASSNEEPDIVNILIDAGAEDVKDDRGRTALMYTLRGKFDGNVGKNGSYVGGDHPKVAEALIDAGAYVKEKNNEGESVLDYISWGFKNWEKRFPETCKRLSEPRKINHIDSVDVLDKFDLEARTVAGVKFATEEETLRGKEEAEKISACLSGLDYKNSDSDAQEAMKRLQSYTATVEPIFNSYKNKIQKLVDASIKARTTKFNGQTIILETSEKAKELSELQKIYSAYTDFNEAKAFPEIGLEKIFALLNKMPEEIKFAYFENLSKFEKNLRGVKLSLAFMFSVVISFVAVIAAIIYSAHNWDNWQWWGLRGIAAALIFFIPIIPSATHKSTDNKYQYNYENNFAAAFVILSWFVALSALLKAYDSMIMKIIIYSISAVLTLGFIGCLGGGNTSKRAKQYVADFDKYSSQSEEYLKFKEAKSK